MSLTNLIENVQGWSAAKGLDKAEPIKQMQKLNEEWGELNAGKAKSDKQKLVDSIGDVMVVFTILSQQMKFESIEQLVDLTQHSKALYKPNDVETDYLLLYGGKEIGLIAHRMIDLIFNTGLINTSTQIQFHIRNLTGILAKIAINEGTDLETCLQVAWDEIKGRTGKMVDGVFVKQEDLEDGK